MIPADVRATIAAIVLAHAKGELVTAIYDYDAGAHRNIRANFKDGTLDGHDTARASRLGGTLPDLYDHARRGFIHLTNDPERYTGYDHFSETHFNAMVKGNTCSIYDHDTGKWTQYSA